MAEAYTFPSFNNSSEEVEHRSGGHERVLSNTTQYSSATTLGSTQELKISEVSLGLNATAEDTRAQDLNVTVRREPFDDDQVVSPVKVASPCIANDPSTISLPTSIPPSPRLPEKHPFPFASGCEHPNGRLILLHLISCIVGGSLVLASAKLADHQTIFWARAIVGVGTGLCGFFLGFTLMRLFREFFVAAAWATIIHNSKGDGMPLQDLVNTSEEPASIFAAIQLFRYRWNYAATARKSRNEYDKRPWSLFILCFIFMYILSQLMSFILDRIVIIEATSRHQWDSYREIAVAGDLSEFDIEMANNLTDLFEDKTFLTWTLTPSTTKPVAISFPWEGDDVYFAETTFNQLVPGGIGLGTGTFNYTTERNASVTGDIQSNAALVWYPRWGIRIKCKQIASSQTLIQRSQNDYTYLFIPRNVLLELFGDFGMDLPQNLTFSYDPTSNGTLETGDMLPDDAKDAADSGSFALGVKFWDNGVATSFYDYPAVQGQDGNGWVSIETVLVRLNNSYAPRATFPVWGDSLVINGTESKIGYDAAVCVEVFEPYVLETFNSSALPYSTRIVGKTSTIHANFGDAESQGRKVGNFQDDSVHTGLNSSGLFDVFRTLHGNSVNIMLKDNGRDAFYVPNPSLISFTSGHGWNDYTSLDANLFAKAKASADASNLLPYFAGSAQVAARRYEDVENASVHLNLIPLMILIASVWIMGTIAGLFVPRLPMKVPRRGFQLYSWLAAFIGGEIEVLAAQDGKNIARSKYMSLTDMEKEFGKVRVKYNFAADGAMEKV